MNMKITHTRQNAQRTVPVATGAQQQKKLRTGTALRAWKTIVQAPRAATAAAAANMTGQTGEGAADFDMLPDTHLYFKYIKLRCTAAQRCTTVDRKHAIATYTAYNSTAWQQNLLC